jgi:hypothetical protein
MSINGPSISVGVLWRDELLHPVSTRAMPMYLTACKYKTSLGEEKLLGCPAAIEVGQSAGLKIRAAVENDLFTLKHGCQSLIDPSRR